MKKLSRWMAISLLLGACTLLQVGCSKVKSLVNVNIPIIMTIPFTINPVSNAGAPETITNTVYANIDSLIKAKSSSLSASNIKSIVIDSVTITVNSNTQFPQDNFTALQSISESFSSNSNATPVEIGSVSTPSNPYFVNIPINASINLTDYFNATTFIFTTNYQMIRPTTQAVNCTGSIYLMMKVGG